MSKLVFWQVDDDPEGLNYGSIHHTRREAVAAQAARRAVFARVNGYNCWEDCDRGMTALKGPARHRDDPWRPGTRSEEFSIHKQEVKYSGGVNGLLRALHCHWFGY